MRADRLRILILLVLSIGMLVACAIVSRMTPVSNLVGIVVLYAFLWVAAVALLFLFPRALSSRKTILFILVVSVLTRLAMLPYPPSDDINRYLWEGRVLAAGYSPYAYAPDAPLLSGLAKDDPFHAYVNHPNMPAAYPPLMLGLFSGISRIWYHPLAIKWVVILFDLVAILFLFELLRARHLPLRWAFLYAFNPLVLFSFAGEGHFDAIQAALLTGAVLCHTRKRWVWAFLMAGLAVQVKYVAVFALPFLINRENWRYAWISVAAAVVPYLPIVLLDPRQLFHCLLAFGSEFAFNGPIHGVLRGVLGSMTAATVIVKVAFFGVLSFAYIRLMPLWMRCRNKDPLPGILLAFGALLLLSPTVHYWYLSWILPFAVVLPVWGWLVATLTIGAYFTVCRTFALTGAWEISSLAFAIEWIPVLGLLAWEGAVGIRRLRNASANTPAKTLSVLVPVINEAQRISACCEILLSNPLVTEVLVSDGGSRDDTLALAEKAGAMVVVAGLEHVGRGGQIYAALQRASGDVVAIVHADTVVPPESWDRMLAMLQANPGVVGGSLGCSFDGGDGGIRIVEVLNDIRATCLSVSFGDQVQFFRRQVVMEHNLFPAIPLMEDVELSLRLLMVGRTVHLFGLARVSLRGWQKHKVVRAVFIIRLVGTYLFRRLWGEVDTHAMYERYYGKSL